MKAGDETEATVRMSDEVLDCRNSGRHLFPRFSAYLPRLADAVMTSNGKRTSMKFRDLCAGNCGVQCEVEYAVPSMGLVSRSLIYPRDEDGNDLYLIPRELRFDGIGRLTGEELRRAMLARVVQAKRARRRRPAARAAS
jgi:hypothetical protein